MNVRGLLFTIGTFAALLLLPWPFAVLIAAVGAIFEPLLPLAAGLFAEALYYSPAAGLPLFAIFGALATLLSYVVRARLKASIIG